MSLMRVSMRIADEGVRWVQGKSWVDKLLAAEYDTLLLSERVEALCDLLHQTLDTPSMRGLLDKRCDEVDRVKKQMRDEAKVERQKLQKEQGERAKRETAEATTRINALQQGQMRLAQGTLPIHCCLIIINFFNITNPTVTLCVELCVSNLTICNTKTGGMLAQR